MLYMSILMVQIAIRYCFVKKKFTSIIAAATPLIISVGWNNIRLIHMVPVDAARRHCIRIVKIVIQFLVVAQSLQIML